MPVFRGLTILLFLCVLGFSPPVFSIPASCVADATSLCLNQQRFKVEVDWRDEAGNAFTVADVDQSGSGQAVGQFDDAGFFWFTNSDYNEVMVKVLEGCGINNNFWVFAAATTNVEYTIRVTDTQSGQIRSYFNPLGQVGAPIQDTQAFNTCPGATMQTAVENPVVVATGQVSTVMAQSTSCAADATTMCMHGNRFSVVVDWEDFTANTGQARAVNLGDKSGYFWFFDSENPELLINIIDGRVSNGFFWVYFSSTTNVKYTVTVTDTTTGRSKQYDNPLGVSLPAVLDNRFTEIPPTPPIPTLNAVTKVLLMMLLALLGYAAMRFGPAKGRKANT